MAAVVLSSKVEYPPVASFPLRLIAMKLECRIAALGASFTVERRGPQLTSAKRPPWVVLA